MKTAAQKAVAMRKKAATLSRPAIPMFYFAPFSWFLAGAVALYGAV
jgi:hypothetical protein